MQDAFGVERGVIHKADEAAQRRNAALWGAVPGFGVAGTIHNATQAKSGRKAAVAGRTYGRQLGESVLGVAPGAALMIGGMKAGKMGLARAGRTGAMVGGLAGSSHASYAAMRNAQRRGDVE